MNIIRTITKPKNPKSKILGLIKPLNYTTISQESNPKPPPSDKITSIADEITTLTLLEVSDLTNLLSKKLQIKEMPLVFPMIPGMGINLGGLHGGVGGGGGGGAEAEKKAVEEKTVFDLKLEAGFNAGAKIKIIKEVRTFTELGLKEAKELVEKAPAVLKSGVGKEEAEKIVEKMKAIGATVVLA